MLAHRALFPARAGTETAGWVTFIVGKSRAFPYNAVLMSEPGYRQLISYIAPSAPATRRPARGDEPFLRPEIGFTPKWYRQHVDVHFGERWHTDPAYRRDTILRMRAVLAERFAGTPIGRVDEPDVPPDFLTGTYGASFVAALFGVPIDYQEENWPWSKHKFLSDDEAVNLEPPNLDANSFFASFMEQVEWIAKDAGAVHGFMNWQGIINNAFRLRGEELFVDMIVEPERARNVFRCVTEVMIDGTQRLYARQRENGVDNQHFTVSNCLANMVSPEHYEEFLLPCDQRLSEEFGILGVHNCAWNADPLVEAYAKIPNVAYIDMGMDSDMGQAARLFTEPRRSIMYTPMDLMNKQPQEILSDFERIAREYGPCDIVCADIEAGTPDERVLEVVRFCEDISERARNGAI